MRSVVAVACTVLLVLAGCSGFVGSGDSTPSETFTPAPVPADRATLAPGLDADGVTAPRRLGNAHGRVLDERSYRLVANHTVRYPNGTARSVLRVDIRLDAERRYLTTVRAGGHAGPGLLGQPPARGTFWSNGSVYAVALTRDNGTTYNRFQPPDGYAGTWPYWIRGVALDGAPGEDTTRLFAAIDVTVVERTTVNGTARYILRGREAQPGELPVPGGLTDPRNATVRAVVRDDGLVERYRVRYTANASTGPVTVVRAVRYEGVGATTVERPSWFASTQ
jgi:hypothetical protein